MIDEISKEFMLEWLQHPVTKKVIKELSQAREDFRQVLTEGGMLDMTSTEKTALQTARTVGRIEGLNLLLEIDIKENENG